MLRAILMQAGQGSVSDDPFEQAMELANQRARPAANVASPLAQVTDPREGNPTVSQLGLMKQAGQLPGALSRPEQAGATAFNQTAGAEGMATQDLSFFQDLLRRFGLGQ